jgi:aspartate oxidase
MIIGFNTQIMPEMAARTLCPSADQPGSEPNFAGFCKRLMLAGARWIYRAARARTETRGLHRWIEYPQSDPTQREHIVLTGLDEIHLMRVAVR